MLPSIFGENLFDNWMTPSFDSFDRSFFGHSSNLMKTDVKETDNDYQVNINLPGCSKDDINVQFENGTLSVTATAHRSNDEKDADGNYIRRERYAGSCSRQFYVGRDIKKEDISAKMNDGVLTLTIPKTEAQKVDDNTTIAITD